ncbi:PEGA domain-containing protein [Candidatus Uhrbacteria bacterium]|nr:PEGA domain-containing protein [Candidatus Uhrbacteria bacterium]
MPIYIRRTIFTFFVFVFLVSASAIIFYGSGYRWNGAKNKIEKTGQFSLDSKPRGAVVYINGEPLRGTWKKIIGAPYETTPAVIKNLLPGEWTVEIRKDGYYSWKKQVRVISGKTAIFHGIRLIKNNIPEQLIHGNILQFSAVSDVAIAALTREDFFIYDMRQKTARVLFHADRDPLVSFSARPNADKFFVRTRDRQWIIDSQGKKTDIVPSVRDSSAFEIVRWSENGELFGKTKDGIIRVSSQPLAFEKVAHESPDDFFVRNGRLFSIAGKQKKTVSMRDLKRTESSRIEILTLPGGGSFIDEPSHDIVIQK